MSNSSKVLLNNAFLLTLCGAIGVSGHPWLALIPLIGFSWVEKDKS